MILIEAKFRSGKSSEEDDDNENPTDQLAREWDHLVRRARKAQAGPWLIYLTADLGVPKEGLQASIEAYQNKRPGDSFPPRMLALTWRELPELFRRNEQLMLQDLCALADRLGLFFFHGVRIPRQTSRINWSYNTLPSRWIHREQRQQIDWSFDNAD